MRTSLAPLASALLAQRGHLIPWAPVALSTGIGLWFALPVEPGMRAYAALAGLALVAGLAARRLGEAWSPLGWGVVLVALGMLLAGARAHQVAAPVLGFRYYGPVEGRVVGLDRSLSNVPRITLDRVTLSDVPPRRVPHRVRVALHGNWMPADPLPGARMMTTAHLSPPPDPAEPGGYDFRRTAWFAGLGAVGYTRSPVLIAEDPATGDWRMALFSARMTLSNAIRQAIPGREGAFAAAILTGDRAGIDLDVLAALRASNLAHLLAISGLHMGLLTGFVFAAARLGVAAVPPLALRLPGRKVAAALALPAACGYLLVSGAAVATERAFVMVAVMLVAVLLDRRALSLRAVALAALIVLALRPESLVTAGFQMSFAATVALVAVFTALRDWQAGRPDGAWSPPRWLRPALAVLISSAVAGAATAPIAAAHFNQSSAYGLLANLASVPVMGAVVMPAGVVALCLTPLGLAAPAWAAMGAGIAWILAVAETVAGWPGAVRAVIAPGPAVLPLIAGGAIYVILWQGRARLLGLIPVVLAGVLWAGTERPVVLISGDGALIGVLGADGARILNKPKGQGFAASSWLENDGDRADQAEAAARTGPPRVTVAQFRKPPEAPVLDAICAAGGLVVLSKAQLARPNCLILDRDGLRKLGAVAVQTRDTGLALTGALPAAGRRLWTQRHRSGAAQ